MNRQRGHDETLVSIEPRRTPLACETSRQPVFRKEPVQRPIDIAKPAQWSGRSSSLRAIGGGTGREESVDWKRACPNYRECAERVVLPPVAGEHRDRTNFDVSAP